MTRVKIVSREKYINFIGKAEQFYEIMKEAYEENKYDTSVMLAVHCAISYVDALTVRKFGKKSSPTD